VLQDECLTQKTPLCKKDGTFLWRTNGSDKIVISLNDVCSAGNKKPVRFPLVHTKSFVFLDGMRDSLHSELWAIYLNPKPKATFC